MKKYMKLTAALLAGAMALSLTACGGEHWQYGRNFGSSQLYR